MRTGDYVAAVTGKSERRFSLFHRAFQLTIYNGSTNTLKRLIQMSEALDISYESDEIK
jgi:hypothetical protein